MVEGDNARGNDEDDGEMRCFEVEEGAKEAAQWRLTVTRISGAGRRETRRISLGCKAARL